MTPVTAAFLHPMVTASLALIPGATLWPFAKAIQRRNRATRKEFPMALVTQPQLHISEGNLGFAFVEVSYRIDPTHQDLALGQSYREIVELVGIDEGPGEDGRNELIPNGRIFDEVFSFAQPQAPRTRAARVSPAILDEDPGPRIREDEIRARVTLIAVPSTVVAESNLFRRGAPANEVGSGNIATPV